jgi:methionine sulfoxide reductase heme-binding subunit
MAAIAMSLFRPFYGSVSWFSCDKAIAFDRNWQILHTVGMYYLWLAFTVSFSERLNESMFIYPLFVSLLIIAIALHFIIPIVSRKSRVDLHS